MWHGAWCWDLLTAELATRGHDARAVDLPTDDKDAMTSEVCTQLVVDSLDGVGDDVVVVGHSMGGLLVPLVGNARPTRRLVWIAGAVRLPGKSMADHNEAGEFEGAFVEGFGAEVIEHPDGAAEWPADAAARTFYHDCDDELAADAASRLRPQHTLWFERAPDEPWPDVPRAAVVCTLDRAMGPAWARRVAREWLDVEPIEMETGHSPMLAKPAELAEILVGLV